MSLFSDIPTRRNGDTFYASWVNDIKTALVAFFGAGMIGETQFTIADNQVAYADITGLLLDSTITRAVDIEYTIYRTNGGATERRERGTLRCLYKPVALAWSFDRESFGDDALNIASSLNVTSAGQVQYKSDSIGATYVGKIRYKVVTAFDKET